MTNSQNCTCQQSQVNSRDQCVAHQFVSTKEAPLVRGPGQLWPCVALYNLASLNHRIHSAFSSSSSKPKSCSWLALQQKVLLAKWDVAAKDDAAFVHHVRACPKGQVHAILSSSLYKGLVLH